MPKGKEKSEGALEDFVVSIEDKKKVELIMRRYNAGVDHKMEKGFYEDWPEYDRFWNGDQWPAPTEKTKNFPRPVNNQFASIIEQKIAGITYEMPDIYFEPMDVGELPEIDVEPLGAITDWSESRVDLAEALSHVAKHQWETIEMEDLVDKGARSSALLGTGIWFFPWDNSIIGRTGKLYVGDIGGYEIDPINFFPGDPSSSDMQRQPWVLVSDRVPLVETKETYRDDAPEAVDKLQPESQSQNRIQVYDQQKNEQATDYVDVFHMWEKVWVEPEDDDDDGEDLEISNEDGSTEKVRRLPRLRLDYTVVCQGYVLKYEEGIYQHCLYPFAHFPWYPKRKSFFGKPESADLINWQKEENRLAGIALLSVYNTGLPNIRVKTNFVKKESIPPGPGGGIIEDNSPPGQWGIDYMQPPTPASNIPGLRAAAIESMKDTSGAHETWSGKAPGARLNASAIIALQEAAGIRIRGVQRRLHKAMREIGRIWLAHWKEFHQEDRFIKIMGEGRAKGFMWFNASNYADLEFDVKVKAGPASPFAHSLVMSNLDKLYERGGIDTREYLENIPTEVFPGAETMLRKREKIRIQAEEQLWQKQQQLAMQMVTQLAQQAMQEGLPIAPESIQHLMGMMEDTVKQTSMEAAGAPEPPVSQ